MSSSDQVPVPLPTLRDTSPVTGITMDFTQVTPELAATHGYVTIHYEDGKVETLGGHAANDALKDKNEQTPLLMKLNHDIRDPRDVRESFDLHAPPGETLTQYANSLPAGDDAYNQQPVNYSEVGEDGYNSTSLASSLLVAKGGQTALADINYIARNMNVGRIRMTVTGGFQDCDSDYARRVAGATVSGRVIATGLDHASMPAAMFEHGIRPGMTPTDHSQNDTNTLLEKNTLSAIGAEAYDHTHALPEKDLAHHVASLTVQENGAANARSLSNFGPQTGTVASLDGDVLKLNVGGSRSPLTLSRNELMEGSRNPRRPRSR